MVEIVTNVPRESCAATLNTPFAQPKNHLNYTYEQAALQANPVPFFESLGYKIVVPSPFSKAASSIRKWSTSGH
jgi:hypothetical protein